MGDIEPMLSELPFQVAVALLSCCLPLCPMALSLAFAAVLGHKVCRSIVPNVQDDWCDTSCNGKTQNCVAEFCECDPSPNCKSHSKSVKNSWCNDNCPVGNCPPTICSCPGDPTAAAAPAATAPTPVPVDDSAAPLEQAPAPTAVPVADAPPVVAAPLNTTVPVTKGCGAMTSITAAQMQCVFPILDAGNAATYAASATLKVGPLLGTTCAWAAFFGNVGVESFQLTLWKEIGCKTQPPYCGRGPLQLTGTTNYNFCASQPSCGCPTVSSQIESAAKNADVGFGTAACIWGALFGSSLSPLADGTHAGFLKTCCKIHQGHYPCQHTEQYANREEYWRTASTCFGVAASADNQYLRTSRPSVLHVSAADDARQEGANRWFAEQQTLQARNYAL